MPIHTLLSIFDDLNIADQSAAITQNRPFRDLLSKHHLVGKIRRINHLSIWIGDDDSQSNDTIINDANSSFDNQLTAMFQSIPQIFTSIKIYNVSSSISERSIEFLQKINENCSNSLEELTLFNMNRDVFNEWKLPFNNVTGVTIKNSSFPDHFDLNGMFPELHRLVIESGVGPNLSMLNQHFSHLTAVFIGVTEASYEHNEPFIAEMIRLNPQLRSLHMPIYGDRRILQDLHEKLPNLQVLSLDGRWYNESEDSGRWPNDNESIVVKNIKKFSWNSRDSAQVGMKIPMIEFDQHLETYDISLDSKKLNNEEISILTQKYVDLKRLVLRLVQMDFDQIVRIAQSMTKLELLGMQWQESIEQTGLTQILIGNEKLEKILIFSTADGPTNEEVSKIFPEEWICEGDRVKGFNKFISFVRKTKKLNEANRVETGKEETEAGGQTDHNAHLKEMKQERNDLIDESQNKEEIKKIYFENDAQSTDERLGG